MSYNVNGISLDDKEVNEYLESSVNRVFALLGIYEDCMEMNDFDNYSTYLNRLITEFNGVYYLVGAKPFLSLVGTLEGMTKIENIEHKTVKSLTFHCISILKKARVV